MRSEYVNSKGNLITKHVLTFVMFIVLVITGVSSSFCEVAYGASSGTNKAYNSTQIYIDYPGQNITSKKIDIAVIKYLLIKNIGSIEELTEEEDFGASAVGFTYKGQGQCWGYAEQCRMLFGTGGKKHIIRRNLTDRKLKKLLKNLRPGTHIRYGKTTDGNGNHSICFLGMKGNRVYYTQTNYSNNPMRLDSFDLDLRYDDPTYIAWYIEPKGRYYSSKVDLVAANIVQNETIELAWLPVKDAKKYIIYRSNKKSGSFKKIKTVNRAWYVDRKANAGNVYYKVKAVGAKTKTSKVVRVMRKLKNPDYSIEYDPQGYPIVTWDKVRGAKLYALYSSDFLKKKYMKTIKTNKYKFKTAKQSDSHYMVVPMIKKGSKANGSGTYIYADRKILAPKMKFVSDGDIGAEFTIKIDQDLGWLKGKKIWVTLERSESSKDGGYLDASTKILRTGSNGKFKFDYKKEFNMKDELGRGMEKDRYYRVIINWNNEYGYKKSGFNSDPILVKAAS